MHNACLTHLNVTSYVFATSHVSVPAHTQCSLTEGNAVQGAPHAERLTRFVQLQRRITELPERHVLPEPYLPSRRSLAC